MPYQPAGVGFEWTESLPNDNGRYSFYFCRVSLDWYVTHRRRSRVSYKAQSMRVLRRITVHDFPINEERAGFSSALLLL